MKKALVLLVGMAVLAGTGMQFAQAGPLEDIVVALHLQPLAKKNNCTSGQAGLLNFGCHQDPDTPSSDLVVQGTLNTGYDMYIVMLDIPPDEGSIGIELGLSFSDDGTGADGVGMDAFGETVCSSLQFATDNWPAGDGTASSTYTWATCQNTVDTTDPEGEIAVVCGAIYAFAYSPDTACIEIKPTGIYGVTDCEAGSSDLTIHFPDNSGCAGFDQPGKDPCLGPVPVQETTWGSIKRQFSSN